MNLFNFDKNFIDQKTKIIAGADEVGRGTLAGPVVASMVILPENANIPELNDSKKLSPEKREKIYEIIKNQAIAISTSFIDEETIDKINISEATKLAMTNCLAEIQKTYTPDLLLIDGNFAINTKIRQKSIVKGDAKSASIASASIIAKVERDRFMTKIHEKYPVYGFDENKGYGSQQHLDAISQNGPCEIHRKSFSPIKEIFSTQLEFNLL